MSFLEDDLIVYIENPKESKIKNDVLELMSGFSKVTG